MEEMTGEVGRIAARIPRSRGRLARRWKGRVGETVAQRGVRKNLGRPGALAEGPPRAQRGFL